jgi:ubiquinone/menaquinone biosynthesis C-methylase UbiE
MKLSKRILQQLDSKMVQKINETYHNLENICYDKRHDEILNYEQIFWKNITNKYLMKKEPIACLDYGTGTGFVPEIIGPCLKEEDSLVSCDVSDRMLKICQTKLKQISVSCNCSFHKIDDGLIPVPDNSIDVITINSVLHHIFDLNCFAAECKRILKPSGLLIVAHEPNKDLRLPFHGSVLRGFAKVLFRPKAIFFRIAESIPFMEKFMRAILSKVSESYRRRNKMLIEISQQMRNENLLDFDLRGTEIQQIVDFHAQSGFTLKELLTTVFSKFELVESETYCHLGFFANNKLAGLIERYIKKNWPDAGKELRFVLKRI